MGLANILPILFLERITIARRGQAKAFLERGREMGLAGEAGRSRNFGDGTVVLGKQISGPANAAVNDEFLRRLPGCGLECAAEMRTAQARLAREFLDRKLAGKILFDPLGDASQRAGSQSLFRLRRKRCAREIASDPRHHRIGEAALHDVVPVKNMMALGVPLAAGTDATRVSSYNPSLAIHSRRRLSGRAPFYLCQRLLGDAAADCA